MQGAGRHHSARATLYVDDHEVGLTPVPFTPIYYGNRTIRLVKDGYETLTVKQYLPPPWYEVPPLDFVSENVVPGKLNDSRTLDFQLRPQTVVPKEELLARAENLRRGTQKVSGVATPGFRINSPARGPVYVPPRDPWRAADRRAAVLSASARRHLPGDAGTDHCSAICRYAERAATGPADLSTPPPSPAAACGPAGPPDAGSQPYYSLPTGQ